MNRSAAKGVAWVGSAAGLGVMDGPVLDGWLAEVNFAREVQFGYFIFSAFSVPFFVADILALMGAESLFLSAVF